MKKTKIFAMLLSLACAAGFYSCSDDNDLKPALQSPTVSETTRAYNTLSFEWSEVANAVQYGYRLSDEGGVAVKAGVTHNKSVTITGLQPATTYTLEVWAFASMDGDYSTPPAVTQTATTDALVKLGTPINLTATSEDDINYTVSWTAVTDAETYAYSIRKSSGEEMTSASTSDTEVAVKDLETGDYVFSVYAMGYDGFESGSAASVSFHVEVPEVIKPVYTVKGLYNSAQMNASWYATMEAYADGTYKILAFYGVEGYDLDFMIDASNPDDMFKILNGEFLDDGYNCCQVLTGLSDPKALIAYTWVNYSFMTGDQSAGTVEIANFYGEDYEGWGYDVFSWPVEDSGMSVDDLVGSYNNHCYGWNSINDNWTWEEFDAPDWEATITKVSNNSVVVDGLYWLECPVTGTVNFEYMTITFQPQNYWSEYIFASTEDISTPVEGYINGDGSITIPDFALWWGGSTYLEASADLTKTTAAGAPVRRLSPKQKAPYMKQSVKKHTNPRKNAAKAPR